MQMKSYIESRHQVPWRDMSDEYMGKPNKKLRTIQIYKSRYMSSMDRRILIKFR